MIIERADSGTPMNADFRGSGIERDADARGFSQIGITETRMHADSRKSGITETRMHADFRGSGINGTRTPAD
jgi:hypothetical protein